MWFDAAMDRVGYVEFAAQGPGSGCTTGTGSGS
jgi:hypothetical protein